MLNIQGCKGGGSEGASRACKGGYQGQQDAENLHLRGACMEIQGCHLQCMKEVYMEIREWMLILGCRFLISEYKNGDMRLANKAKENK